VTKDEDRKTKHNCITEKSFALLLYRIEMNCFRYFICTFYYYRWI